METRIVGAAVDLFATRGIDATSLQMIADALGITKGAVYYHFKTKHEIVLAVCADSFDALEAAVAEAETIESVTSRERALDRLVPRLVAQAVESRSVFSKLRFDPVMVRLMADDARYEDLLGATRPAARRRRPRCRSPRAHRRRDLRAGGRARPPPRRRPRRHRAPRPPHHRPPGDRALMTQSLRRASTGSPTVPSSRTRTPTTATCATSADRCGSSRCTVSRSSPATTKRSRSTATTRRTRRATRRRARSPGSPSPPRATTPARRSSNTGRR